MVSLTTRVRGFAAHAGIEFLFMLGSTLNFSVKLSPLLMAWLSQKTPKLGFANYSLS